MKEKTLENCNCKTNIEKLRNQERKRNKFRNLQNYVNIATEQTRLSFG